MSNAVSNLEVAASGDEYSSGSLPECQRSVPASEPVEQNVINKKRLTVRAAIDKG